MKTDSKYQNLIEIANVSIDQVEQQAHAEELTTQAKLLTQLAHEIQRQFIEFMYQNKLSGTKDLKPSYSGFISTLYYR